jgi:hypothetical protein
VFPPVWHRYIFLIGIIGLASGMMFGTVPTSIPQIVIAANWLLEGDFRNKWERIRLNRIFWLLISFYILHLIGMFYTAHTQNGLDDLRNKLPLLILPVLFFSTKALSLKEFRAVFFFFFAAVIISSVCCFVVYAGYTKKIILDARQASVFMSHIRFSLFIAFAVTGMLYYVFREKSFLSKMLFAAGCLWLLFFMYALEMATGFICLLLVIFLLSLVYSFTRFNKAVSITVVTVLTAVFMVLAYGAYNSLHMYEPGQNNASNTLLDITVNRRPYLQDTVFKLAENGNLIAVNINDVELRNEWEKKSELAYLGKDKKGNDLRFTVMRYLASKGLHKDSLGLNMLSTVDIQNIEKGFTNYKYAGHTGLITRWHELIWEYTKYRRGENPSGHTLMMRLEFWKTACYIIQQNGLLGVGTGDIQASFNQAYKERHSQLNTEWRLRCHNQYLAIGVAFGLCGLLWFVIYLFYPAISLRKKLHALYWPFFFIALLSFFTEDTLETQSGVTFFIFFQTLFLWLASYKEPETK